MNTTSYTPSKAMRVLIARAEAARKPEEFSELMDKAQTLWLKENNGRDQNVPDLYKFPAGAETWLQPLARAILTNPSVPLAALGNEESLSRLVPRYMEDMAENPALMFWHAALEKDYVDLLGIYYGRAETVSRYGVAVTFAEDAVNAWSNKYALNLTRKSRNAAFGRLFHSIAQAYISRFYANFPLLPVADAKATGEWKVASIANWHKNVERWKTQCLNMIPLGVDTGYQTDQIKAFARLLIESTNEDYDSYRTPLIVSGLNILRERARPEERISLLTSEILPRYIAWMRLISEATEQPMPKHLLWRIFDMSDEA